RILFEVEQAWQRAKLFHVLAGQDQADTRQATRAADIDGEGPVRMRRAQHQRMHRSRWRMVIGVAALAADERVVFLAQDTLTDAKLDRSSHHLSTCNYDLSSYCSGTRRRAKGLAEHQ